MLRKSQYPQLNRAARRHPERYLQSNAMAKGWSGGGNWLLAGLVMPYMPKPVGKNEGATV